MENIKRPWPQITLRFSILALFISLFSLLVGTLTTLSYRRVSEAIISISHELMVHASTVAYHTLKDELTPVDSATNVASHLIQSGILVPNHLGQMATYARDILQSIPNVQMVNWGMPNGSYVLAYRNADNQLSTEIIDRAHATPTGLNAKYTSNDQLLQIAPLTTTDLNYDPRTRSWYQQAVAEKKAQWTNIYTFYTSHQLGVSRIVPVYSQTQQLLGVFSIDLALTNLSAGLNKVGIHHDGAVFIVNQQGQVVAFPLLKNLMPKDSDRPVAVAEIPLEWIGKSYAQYQKTQADFFSFKHQGARYLASYRAIPAFTQYGWLIGVVVPLKSFVAELIRTNQLIIMVGLIILLIGVFIVSVIAARIVRPLRLLMKEAHRIKRFQLDGQLVLNTRITEIGHLFEAILAMKHGLRSFKKYIPATLARNLMRMKEDTHLGGKKKILTVLFSDIENFTTIAENMHPEVLLTHICDYFEELTKIILEEQGTIDKYIGDSIMAFWNAPINNKQHALLACRAALRCQALLKELNAQWQRENKPMLKTRIGIHTGEAIVGNMGSSERFNYTVLGDTINIASRLQVLNKTYGTQILVSDSTYELLKDYFVFRKVAHVAVRGRIQRIDVFELLAEQT